MDLKNVKIKVVDDLVAAMSLSKILYGEERTPILTSGMLACEGKDLNNEISSRDWPDVFLELEPITPKAKIQFDIEKMLIGTTVYDSYDNEYVIVGWCEMGPIVSIVNKEEEEEGGLMSDSDLTGIHCIDIMLCDQNCFITTISLDDDNLYFTSNDDNNNRDSIEIWLESERDRRFTQLKKVESKTGSINFIIKEVSTLIADHEFTNVSKTKNNIKVTTNPKPVEKKSLGALLKLT